MPFDLLAGLSGVMMIFAGVVVLARTHGPQLSLPAAAGMASEVLGAAAAALAWRGGIPGWAVPVALVLAALAVWAVVGGRRRPPAVTRWTGFGELDE